MGTAGEDGLGAEASVGAEEEVDEKSFEGTKPAFVVGFDAGCGVDARELEEEPVVVAEDEQVCDEGWRCEGQKE